MTKQPTRGLLGLSISETALQPQPCCPRVPEGTAAVTRSSNKACGEGQPGHRDYASPHSSPRDCPLALGGDGGSKF
ncbi:hypothetical protein J1605_007614 [Eschrichtius robustus]|uniref:Uncharacterized protein n=1 Tax=Eschrichtius robustus TaxID=9764 RepID=A0AB34GY68_ESCRO|nr:hypothetical protein J1605_007614 [Eschrichtius robustus]